MEHNVYKLTAGDIINQLVNLRQLTFEVTDACNLKCTYCGLGDIYDGHDLRQDKYLSMQWATIIIDYLVDIWDNYATTNKFYHDTLLSFYGGEPLLNMNLIKGIISYAEQKDTFSRNFRYSMTTNAMLLDKHMDYLAEKKIKLLISIDGDEWAHSYRVDHSGHNSFHRVFNNIKLLKEKYPTYFEECIAFNSVITDRNEVSRAHKFIYDNFDKAPNISPLNNSGIRETKRGEFDKLYKDVIISADKSEDNKELQEQMFILHPRINELSNFIQRASENYYIDYLSLLFDSHKFAKVPTGTCLPFQKRMFVTVNGKIIQCERIDHCYALGEVTNEGVNLDLDEIANRYNERIESIQHLCKKCERNAICSQCIYYIDNLGQKNIKCNGFMNKERFEAYKQSNMNYLARYPHLYKKLMEDVLIDY